MTKVSRFAAGTARLITALSQGNHQIIRLSKSAIADVPPNRSEVLGRFGIPAVTNVVSIMGDSQPYDEAGSKVWIRFLRQNLTAGTTVLFGVTGRSSGKLVDVNGGVTRVIADLEEVDRAKIHVIGQIVDQSLEAIEKWGCETLPPELISGLILVAGEGDRKTVFGDDIGLEGQLCGEYLDDIFRNYLIRYGDKLDGKNTDSTLIDIMKKVRDTEPFNNIDRQNLMYFFVEKGISLSEFCPDVTEILLGGISDSVLVGSGGSQSLWQSTINTMLDNPLKAVCGLRGPENPKTTVIDGGVSQFRDFTDTAEFFGYLAYSKNAGEKDIFRLLHGYTNGFNTRASYPSLHGVRLPYNPDNTDVAREDKTLGGLNSKMRMFIQSVFVLGCLDGYNTKLNPDNIRCEALVREGLKEADGALLPYSDAAKKGLVPTPGNPIAGKYHNHGTTLSPATSQSLANQTDRSLSR